jgi:hypothetical protein
MKEVELEVVKQKRLEWKDDRKQRCTGRQMQKANRWKYKEGQYLMKRWCIL